MLKNMLTTLVRNFLAESILHRPTLITPCCMRGDGWFTRTMR